MTPIRCFIAINTNKHFSLYCTTVLATLIKKVLHPHYHAFRNSADVTRQKLV